MPKVPLLNQTSVQEQRLPDARVNVSVTPEQIAGPQVRLLQTLGAGADQITNFVVQRQNALDLDVVTRGENAMKEVLMEQTLLAQQRVGIGAKDLLKDQEEFFGNRLTPSDGQISTEATARLGSVYDEADERQKAAMDVQLNKLRTSHLKTMGAHETSQLLAAANGSHAASRKANIALGIMNPNDDEALKVRLDSLRDNEEANAALNGRSRVETELNIATDRSAIHTGVIKRLIDSGTIEGSVRAKEYFKKNQKEILGDQSTIAGLVKNSTVLSESRLKAQEISALPIGQQQAALDKISNGDVFLKTRELVATRNKNVETVKAQTKLAKLDEVSKGFLEGRYKTFDDLPADLQAGMGIETIAKVKTFLEGQAAPTDAENGAAYRELSNMMLDNPEKFLTTKFDIEYAGEASAATIKHFEDQRTKLKEGKLNHGSLLSQASIRTNLKGIVRLNDPGMETVASIIDSQVDAAVLAMEDELGKKLDQTQFRAVAQAHYTSGQVKSLKQHIAVKPLKDVATLSVQISDAVDIAKLEKEDAAKFSQVTNSTIFALQTQNGKVPTQAERQVVIDRLVGNIVKVDGVLSNPEKMALLLSDDEYEKAFVTSGGSDFLLKTLDSLSPEKASLVRTYIARNGLPMNYQSKAVALQKLDLAIDEVRSELERSSGAFKASDGSSQSRSAMLDNFRRLDVGLLIDRRKDVQDRFGTKGVQLLDRVVKEKQREARDNANLDEIDASLGIN
jgi:hypothetical protein